MRRHKLICMSGPATKPARTTRKDTFAPHPDDVEALREGVEQADRDELLSAEESAAHLRALLGDEPAKR